MQNVSDSEIRIYRPGEEGKIVQLLAEVFGGWPKFDLSCSPLDHWRWKYLKNSFSKSLISIAMSNDKMIGCNHSITVKIKIGGKTFLGTLAGDTGVHSEFRKRGVWESMLELTKTARRREGISINYMTTGNPVVIRTSSKVKERHPFPLAVLSLIRIHDMDYHLKKTPIKKAHLKKVFLLLLRRKYALQRIFCPSKSLDPPFTIQNIDRFDQRVNSFWNDVKDHYFFIIARDCDYLNWRYGDPRGCLYSINIAETNGKLLGFIILRINHYNKEYPSGHIVDLLTLPDRLDVAEALVKGAIKFFDDHNVNTIQSLVVKNHPFEAIYRRNIFFGRKAIPFFYDEYERIEGLEDLATIHPKRVYLALGDFDYI